MSMKLAITFLINLFAIWQTINCDECIPRKYFESSFICVCNSTYCDSIKPLPKNLNGDEYVTYTSTMARLRMKQEFGKIINIENRQITPDIILNRARTYQKIMGFGGAMTDSSGINIASLPKLAQDRLMQQYFGDDGIQYTIIRVPVGGTDFSTHPYSLDDTANDTELLDFQLAEEDLKYKIPYIKQAIELSKMYSIKLMGCPWSGPAYMKSNKRLRGMGYLLPEYYQVYANYLTQFLHGYQQHGLNFSIMSAQNEPVLGSTPLYQFNGMAWDAWSQTDFVLNNLAPTLHRNGFNDVKIMVGDDQTLFMLDWVKTMLEYKPNITKYIGGVGIHWYLDCASNLNELIRLRKIPELKNSFMLYTEASENAMGEIRGATFGTWENGETYLRSIINALNHWSEGWVDWNLVLDLQGGPTWIGNYLTAGILVNRTSGEFYKNPIYYAMAHVSKFLVPESIRIHMINNHNGIMATAFDTPDNRTVLVLLNLYKDQYKLLVQDVERGSYKHLEILPYSFMTVIY